MRLAVLLALCQGCAVGSMTYLPEPRSHAPAPDWSGLAMSVDGVESRLAMHVIRARYGAVSSRGDGFHLSFKWGETRDPPLAQQALGALGFLSFSVIPSFYEEEHDLTLVVTSLDGATWSAHRARTTRTVSWLPLGLFGANFSASLGASSDDSEIDRRLSDAELFAQLLTAAEPFVAEHRR